MSWYLTSQTIFAGAFAVLALKNELAFLSKSIPVVGLVLSVLVLSSIYGAAKKIELLRVRNENKHSGGSYYVGSGGAEDYVSLPYRRLTGRDALNRLGFAFPFCAPIVLIVFWAFLLIKASSGPPYIPTKKNCVSVEHSQRTDVSIPKVPKPLLDTPKVGSDTRKSNSPESVSGSVSTTTTESSSPSN